MKVSMQMATRKNDLEDTMADALDEMQVIDAQIAQANVVGGVQPPHVVACGGWDATISYFLSSIFNFEATSSYICLPNIS